MIDTSGSCSLAVMLFDVLWLQRSCGVLLFAVLAVMPLSSPLLKRKTYVSWLKKCVFFGMIRFPRSHSYKTRVEKWIPGLGSCKRGTSEKELDWFKENEWLATRIESSWACPNSCYIWTHNLWTVKMSFFVFWELFWVKLLLDVLTKKNHIWSLCRRIISSDSQLVAEVWIYRCLEPCTNQEPYPKHGKFKHGISYHLFRTQPGKSTADPPKR